MSTAFSLIDLLNSIHNLSNLPSPKGWNFPPSDLIKTGEHTYELHFAVAGIKQDNLEITTEHNILTIKGSFPAPEPEVQYIVKNISRRCFERSFNVHPDVKVGDVTLVDGMLKIKLEHVIPEALKLRKIAITA